MKALVAGQSGYMNSNSVTKINPYDEVNLLVDAAAERLIPTDELGPGGKEAGVSCYIDQQLRSSWGTHGRMYRAGPWLEGTPEQGYQ